MDYIPVYEGEEQEDGKTVRVSVEKVQRSGVRTEVIEARTIIRPVRAVGTVMHDESRLTIVTMRSDGYIEELFVDKSGQQVHAGEPLFRVYSPDIVSAQVNLRNGGGLGASNGCAISACPKASSATCSQARTRCRSFGRRRPPGT